MDLIVANEAVEDVEAPLDGKVDHRALVLRDRGLVREGEEVHEQEHEEVQRLLVHLINFKTLHSKVLTSKNKEILK